MASFLGRVAAVGALASAAGAFLAIEQGCSESPKKAEAPAPIVIGVSLGLSKDLKSFAEPLRDSIRAAEGEINAAGGLLGRPVSFDIVDDQSNEGNIVKDIAEDFKRKNVVAVIGPIGSQQVKETHEIYKSAQILQLTPSATSTDLEKLQPVEDRWLYRTTPDDAFQGAADIPDHGPGLEFPEGDDLSDVISPAVSLDDILEDLLPAVDAEVHVDIRHAFAVRV